MHLSPPQVVCADAKWALVIPMTILSFITIWFVPAAPNTKYLLDFDFQYAVQAGVLSVHTIVFNAYSVKTTEERGDVCLRCTGELFFSTCCCELMSSLMTRVVSAVCVI
jgi:hypothetical protein